MLKKKICMLGAFAVGKTSLVQRYVHSIFSEKYHTTVGVKVDKRQVVVDGQPIDLILWDIQGKDDTQTVRPSYLQGASGCLLVVDGTRSDTLDVALELRRWCLETIGQIPVLFAFNKSDLANLWEIDPERVRALEAEGTAVIETSAKEGAGVELAFLKLAQMMVVE